MKLVIELDSNELRRAVEKQVAAEVSKISREVIEQYIKDIVPKTYERVDGTIDDEFIKQCVSARIDSYISTYYPRHGLRTKIDDTIIRVVKDNIK